MTGLEAKGHGGVAFASVSDLLGPSDVELAAQLEEREDPLELLVRKSVLGGHHGLGDRPVRLVTDPTGAPWPRSARGGDRKGRPRPRRSPVGCQDSYSALNQAFGTQIRVAASSCVESHACKPSHRRM
jgi:hypothetical protein